MEARTRYFPEKTNEKEQKAAKYNITQRETALAHDVMRGHPGIHTI